MDQQQNPARNQADAEKNSAPKGISNWLMSFFGGSSHGSSVEAVKPEIKNKAIMYFDSLPLGKILSPAITGPDDQQSLKISLPVKPQNKTSTVIDPDEQNAILLGKSMRALDSVLYLIEQAVEYDRYCSRKLGQPAIRDQALKPFHTDGLIKSFQVHENLGRPSEIDIDAGTFKVDSDVFADYFYLLRTVLVAGAQFEVNEDESRGKLSSQVANLALAGSLASSRLSMIARYVDNLESGEEKDKIAWKVSLNLHAAALENERLLFSIASELLAIRDSCADSYFASCRGNTLDSESDPVYQQLFKELTCAISELNLPIGMSYCQLTTDHNADVEYFIGFKQVLRDLSGGNVEIDMEAIENLPTSTCSVLTSTGRAELLNLISDSQSLWYANTNVDFSVFHRSFTEKVTQSIAAGERLEVALKAYSDLFLDSDK
jgi:hypothetical protein